MLPADYLSKYVFQKSYFGIRKKEIIGSLASHIGILDDEFEDIFDACKLSKFWSWYKDMGLHVQTHRYHSIT